MVPVCEKEDVSELLGHAHAMEGAARVAVNGLADSLTSGPPERVVMSRDKRSLGTPFSRVLRSAETLVN